MSINFYSMIYNHLNFQIYVLPFEIFFDNKNDSVQKHAVLKNDNPI